MIHAKRVVDASLTDLHQFLKTSGASTRDADVEAYWEAFERAHGDISGGGRARCKWFLALRDGLKADVEACLREWNGLMGPGVMDYREKVGHAYASWRGIRPRLPRDAEPSVVGLVRGFLGEDDDVKVTSLVADLSVWELLKASFAFKLHHQKRFVWQVAGRQLQAIKALSAGGGGEGGGLFPAGDGVPVPVVANMYAALKPDNTYIKRLMALEGEGEGEEVAEESVVKAAGMAGLEWGASQEDGGGGGMGGDW